MTYEEREKIATRQSELAKYKEITRQLNGLVCGIESELKEKTEKLDKLTDLAKEMRDKINNLLQAYGLGKGVK